MSQLRQYGIKGTSYQGAVAAEDNQPNETLKRTRAGGPPSLRTTIVPVHRPHHHQLPPRPPRPLGTQRHPGERAGHHNRVGGGKKHKNRGKGAMWKTSAGQDASHEQSRTGLKTPPPSLPMRPPSLVTQQAFDQPSSLELPFAEWTQGFRLPAPTDTPVSAPPPPPPLPTRPPRTQPSFSQNATAPPPLPTRPKPSPLAKVKQETGEASPLPPSPTPQRRLATNGCKYYPWPEDCQKNNPKYKRNRDRYFRTIVNLLKSKNLKVKKPPLFRADGMSVEWSSVKPVWNDTLLPDINDIAFAITSAATPERLALFSKSEIRERDISASPRSTPTQHSQSNPDALPSAHPSPPPPIIRPSQRDRPLPKPPKKTFKPVNSTNLRKVSGPNLTQPARGNDSIVNTINRAQSQTQALLRVDVKGKRKAVDELPGPPPLPTRRRPNTQPSSTTPSTTIPATPTTTASEPGPSWSVSVSVSPEGARRNLGTEMVPPPPLPSRPRVTRMSGPDPKPTRSTTPRTGSSSSTIPSIRCSPPLPTDEHVAQINAAASSGEPPPLHPPRLSSSPPSVPGGQSCSITIEQSPSIAVEQSPSITVGQQPSIPVEQQPSIHVEKSPSIPVAKSPSIPVGQSPSMLVEQTELPDDDMSMHVDPVEEERESAYDSDDDILSVVAPLAQQYIMRYMRTFDYDRSRLAGAYSPNARFSVSVHRVPGPLGEGVSSAEVFCPEDRNHISAPSTHSSSTQSPSLSTQSQSQSPSQCPSPSTSTLTPTRSSSSLPRYHQGRAEIVQRLKSLGPHKFDYSRNWKPPSYDLVLRPLPYSQYAAATGGGGAARMPRSESNPTSSSLYNGNDHEREDHESKIPHSNLNSEHEVVLLTVHGNVVDTDSETGEDHVVSVHQSFVLCRPEDLGCGGRDCGVVEGVKREEEEGEGVGRGWEGLGVGGVKREEDESHGLELGLGLGLGLGLELDSGEDPWPLLALSHQMVVRDGPMLFPGEVEDVAPWVSRILDLE
ncbi:hypothetical protein CC2G_011363 [Coprinopsis cinerea AmutBmut pab1-1]|nr:hypothetical protein CC2G_011363 [Coprinopsis cinerea AmutBmut pab1-1]